ncbi:MAG: hypothetical protein U0Q18_13490 [Bryobacteraceae bacterium]
MPKIPVDQILQRSAEEQPEPRTASSRLKSRIFSALQLEQQESGPLLSLTETHAAGGKLCVFEDLVRIAPIGERLKQKNPCRVCHARLLGENVERAPIYWPDCPYVRFQDR